MSLTNGIHHLSREQYNDLDRVNWSSLKPLRRSPAHYWSALKGKSTAAMAQGNAFHMAVLEPTRFSACAIWRGAVRRGKDWEAFRSANAGYDILTEDEALVAAQMAKSVHSNGAARKYLRDGEFELSVLWECDGIPCKSRLDAVSGGAVVELKSTVDSSPRGFGIQVGKLDYLGQAAMYADGLEHATGDRLPVVMIATEKTEPYATSVFRVPDELLLVGRAVYRGLLSTLVKCRETNSWPAYCEGEQVLTVPSWALEASIEVVNGSD